jgi:hypothetical protein
VEDVGGELRMATRVASLGSSRLGRLVEKRQPRRRGAPCARWDLVVPGGDGLAYAGPMISSSKMAQPIGWTELTHCDQ